MAHTRFEPFPFNAFDLPVETIAARFRWARRRGHPGYLWPDVPIAEWRASLEAIERVAAALLARGGMPAALGGVAEATGATPATGSRPEMPALAPASGPARPHAHAPAPALGPVTLTLPGGTLALSVAAYSSGLGPWLGHAHESGALEAEGEAGALLRLHLEHARARARRLEAELLRTLDVLAGAGIRATVLKGAHTARAYFPEPATRPTADLDLAVDDFAAAERALERAGYTLARRQPRPRQSTLVPPGAPTRLRTLALVHADDPYTLDLHASLDRDFFGVRTIRFGPLAEATAPWPALHPGARALHPPTLLAFLAVHASQGLHNLTLLRQLELVLVARADAAAGRLRWPELVACLERAGALRFAYPALALAERLAPGTIDPDALTALAAAATPRMRRIVAGLRPSGAQRPERLSLDERLMWARGPIEHARRVMYMAWPLWIGASPGELRRIYAERAGQVLRRILPWRGAGRHG
ncbi:MAG TPA: nucleotidyltransferase family protein [Longimicrobiales bacterium]